MATENDGDKKEERIRALEAQVQRLQDENRQLRGMAVGDDQQQPQPQQDLPQQHEAAAAAASQSVVEATRDHQLHAQEDERLTKDEVERYSRQLLMGNNSGPLGGVPGQIRLRQARVVVVGAGGIGSTVLLYLAAAGVGHLTVIDFDTVETSNLHRQIIHSTATLGQNKAQSARRAVLSLNPSIQCEAVETAVTVDNAMELLQGCDCVVDASDNPSTRYLLNDACYFFAKENYNGEKPLPLVSGSAVGTEGQCTVYHWNKNGGGGCYRCMYPQQSASSCQSCSDAGVLGPVPGLVGILQAVEVLKVLASDNTNNDDDDDNNNNSTILKEHLLMYDAVRAQFWRLKKPPRQAATCALCGDHATICSLQDTRTNLEGVRGPGLAPCPKPQPFDVSCQEYNSNRQQQQQQQASESHLLLDVRVPAQFALCRLPGAVNLPLRDLTEDVDQVRTLTGNDKDFPIYCVCRRGNASVTAAQVLRAHGWTRVYNLRQGLDAWRREVDPSFPKY